MSETTTRPAQLTRGGCIVPGFPHPLLASDQNAGWDRIRRAFARLRVWLEEVGTERLVVFSTGWPSVIGHQIQAHPCAEWVHVDHEFHSLGSIPYAFSFDPSFAETWKDAATRRGLQVRTVQYTGFPIDTGSVVLMKLLNPDQRFKVNIVSCNVYADRAETVVLGKATRDAIAAAGERTVAVAISALSARQHQHRVTPAEDRIALQKDDEWNRKLIELLKGGRLEDVSQLTRQVTREGNLDQKGKAIWWLSAVLGNTNSFEGDVLAYEPLCGTGGAVVSLTSGRSDLGEPEFDEDDVEVFRGERNVLSSQAPETDDATRSSLDRRLNEGSQRNMGRPPPASGEDKERSASRPVAEVATAIVLASAAPRPVGTYPHARVEGDFLFLSGIGPRHPVTGEVQGGAIRNEEGTPQPYDAAEQTRAVIENVKTVLGAAGASLHDVIDVTCYLIDMDRDFKAFNAVYADYFAGVQATRTTVAVSALPTPIAIEFKVIARKPGTEGRSDVK